MAEIDLLRDAIYDWTLGGDKNLVHGHVLGVGGVAEVHKVNHKLFIERTIADVPLDPVYFPK